MIVAISDEENLFYCLSKNNTNKSLFILFIKYLALKLDEKKPGLKKFSCIIGWSIILLEPEH